MTDQKVAYEVGYRAFRDEQHLLKALSQLTNPVLVDVRFGYMQPGRPWSQRTLEKALGERFVHLRAWGNRNYRSWDLPAELAQPEVGLVEVRDLIRKGMTPVLMCACKVFDECHRKLCVEMLADDGIEVRPLDAGAVCPDPSLFD